MRRSWWAVPTLRASCSRKKLWESRPIHAIISPVGFLSLSVRGSTCFKRLAKFGFAVCRSGAVGLSRLGGKCESPPRRPRNAGGYVAENTRLMYRHSVRKGFRVDVYWFTHRHDLSIVNKMGYDEMAN